MFISIVYLVFVAGLFADQLHVYVGDYVMRILKNKEHAFNLYHAGVLLESGDRKFLLDVFSKHPDDVFRVMFPVNSGNFRFFISGQLAWDNPVQMRITDLETDVLPSEYNVGNFQHVMTLADGGRHLADYLQFARRDWSDSRGFDLFNVDTDGDRKFLNSSLCHDFVEWTLRFFAAKGGRFLVEHIVRDELVVYGNSARPADFSGISDRLKLLQYLAFLALNSQYAHRSFGEARDLFVKPKLLGVHYPVGNGKNVFWVDVRQGGLDLCYVSYNASFHRTARICMMNSSSIEYTPDALSMAERMLFMDVRVCLSTLVLATTIGCLLLLRRESAASLEEH